MLTTDEDIRAAEREQWDDGTNYLAVAPGVVMGYERNVATNTMLRKHGIEVVTHRGQRARPRPRWPPVHDLSDRARPGLAAAIRGDDGHGPARTKLLKEIDFTKDEFLYLVDLADQLRDEKRAGTERQRMVGRNIALIFEKTSTRTRSAFEVGAHDQGAHVTYLGPEESQLGHKETVGTPPGCSAACSTASSTAASPRRPSRPSARYAGVPVWNGLTDQWHPTQMLADMLTMRDHSAKPLEEIAYCYLGDARNNTANSLLVTGALLGMDVRIAAPEPLWPVARGPGDRRRARPRPRAPGSPSPPIVDAAVAGRRLPLHRRVGVDG